MSEPVTTLVGNLVDDPELRFTPSGAAVVNFRIASTPRRLDRASNQWVDGETLFMSCAVWRHQAENVADTLARGMRVVVTGKLKSRSYETQAGEKRTVIELDVEEVGPSLRYATAAVTRRGRATEDGAQPNARAHDRSPSPSRSPHRAEPDPWAQDGAPNRGRDPHNPWGNASAEPPF